MYLLNREYGWNDAGGAAAFTFHYVSIKSKLDGEGVYTGANLHSTMYLLNHKFWGQFVRSSIFTFHYVSIKSFIPFFLKNHLTAFTFHYVSIKSFPFLLSFHFKLLFTFHYVSIKSRIATPYHFSSLFSVFLSTYHHTMLNHMYTSPAFFILRINTRLSMSL